MGTVKRRKRKREGEGNGTAHNMRVGTNDVSFERTGAPGGPALLLLSTEQRLAVRCTPTSTDGRLLAASPQPFTRGKHVRLEV